MKLDKAVSMTPPAINISLCQNISVRMTSQMFMYTDNKIGKEKVGNHMVMKAVEKNIFFYQKSYPYILVRL